MQPGSVVEYLVGKDLALGFCLDSENKGKLPIMNSSGRKESLASKKVLFSHSSPLSPTSTREEKLAHLESVEQRKTKEADALDTAELWELLAEEEEGREWTLAELCGFLFSESGAWEKALVYRALLNDKHRYSRKGDLFVLRTTEQVEEALQREQVEARRQVEREAIKSWLVRVWSERKDECEPEYAEAVDEWKSRIRAVALHGEDASHFQHVQRYLKELDAKGLDVAFQFMVRLGEWTTDQNLEILANETPTVFSQEVLDEARLAGERLETVLAESDRVDLSDWACHSIDDPDTTEIDDALAWRATDDGYELAIHIADASALVTPDLENLEREIRYRATSVYLPDMKVRMVPEVLSDDALSLKQGVPRPAFTFLVRIDESGKLLDSTVQSSVIQVAERLDYDTADERVE